MATIQENGVRGSVNVSFFCKTYRFSAQFLQSFRAFWCVDVQKFSAIISEKSAHMSTFLT